MASKDNRVWARCHKGDSSTGQFRPPALCELMLPNKIKQELTCPICLNVYEEAENLVPCGHTFCKACVGAVAKHAPLCPICKMPANHLPIPAWSLRSIISQQDVHCSNGLSFNTRTQLYEPAKGVHNRFYCKETMVASAREVHERTCEFKLVGCKWTGCAYVAIRSKVEAHQAACDLKVERCTLCKKTVKSSLFDQHVKNECLKSTVQCKNHALGCKISPLRSKLAEHLRKECKFREGHAGKRAAQAGTQPTKAAPSGAGARGKGVEHSKTKTRPQTRSAAQSTSQGVAGNKRKRT